MPYKYIKENAKPGTKVPSEPKITEKKEVEKPKTPETEEEHQLATIKEQEDQFFEEDDEILEVTWD